jgi:hypothetical protein
MNSFAQYTGAKLFCVDCCLIGYVWGSLQYETREGKKRYQIYENFFRKKLLSREKGRTFTK